MEKKRAIESLKKYLEEIPGLRNLHENNQYWTLWVSKAETVIKAGLEQEDLDNFTSAHREDNTAYVIQPGVTSLPYGKFYQEDITAKETALKSIIQKYEILGIEEKPDIEEPPKATKDYEKKAATKELELLLEGTPDMILECIRSTIEKLNSQGYTYSLRRTSGAPDYARWDKTYFASCAISQGDEGQIGTIKLQLLPNERTLFKIPEPKDWDSSFGEFIKHLLAEFKRLGFLYFKEEKPPIGFPLPHREKNV